MKLFLVTLFLNFICIRNLNVYYNFTKKWHIFLYLFVFGYSYSISIQNP